MTCTQLKRRPGPSCHLNARLIALEEGPSIHQPVFFCREPGRATGLLAAASLLFLPGIGSRISLCHSVMNIRFGCGVLLVIIG